MRRLPKIKKVFIRSGLRYDYLMADPDPSFFMDLCRHHISGQLKVAPEHISPQVLAMMGKPGREVYERFVQRYEAVNTRLGLKHCPTDEQPSGSTLQDAVRWRNTCVTAAAARAVP